MTEPARCGQMIWPHECCLRDCPRDDPTWVHMCYADDFDWVEGDFVSYRLGRIDIAELLTRAFTHVYARKHGNMGIEYMVGLRVRDYLRDVEESGEQGMVLKADKTGLRMVSEDGSYTTGVLRD